MSDKQLEVASMSTLVDLITKGTLPQPTPVAPPWPGPFPSPAVARDVSYRVGIASLVVGEKLDKALETGEVTQEQVNAVVASILAPFMARLEAVEAHVRDKTEARRQREASAVGFSANGHRRKERRRGYRP